MPVLAGATIRFRRSLDPFQRFRLRTRVLGWDAKSVIMEQIFETLDGQVAARALVRALGEAAAAASLMTAIEQVLAAGILPPDLGGRAATDEVTGAVSAALGGANL